MPSVAVYSAFVLLGASVAAFIYYINHMAHAIRASSVIASIASETRSAIDRIYPAEADESQAATAHDPEELIQSRRWRTVNSRNAGTVVDVDEGAIIKHAAEEGVIVELVPLIGDFIPRDMPLFRVSDGKHRPGAEAAEEFDGRLRSMVSLDRERTMQQDPAFGFRQLVDVGARALSPGTNDPTTCVQAIDQLHDLLLQLVDRSFPSAVLADDEGEPRLIVRHTGWEEFVRLAVDELGIYAERHIRVVQRLEHMLRSLAERCPPHRVAVVRVELVRLHRQVARLGDEAGAFGTYRR